MVLSAMLLLSGEHNDAYDVSAAYFVYHKEQYNVLLSTSHNIRRVLNTIAQNFFLR
jgi:hypothetical protein